MWSMLRGRRPRARSSTCRRVARRRRARLEHPPQRLLALLATPLREPAGPIPLIDLSRRLSITENNNKVFKFCLFYAGFVSVANYNKISVGKVNRRDRNIIIRCYVENSLVEELYKVIGSFNIKNLVINF